MVTVILGKLIEALGVVFVHTAVQHVVTDRRALSAALSHAVVFRNRRLRVSMSQLLCLPVDDKFVLIPSVKRPGSLAPIGGVVRYYPSEVSRLEGQIGFSPEVEEGEERFDLRGFVEGRNFAPFLRWYASGVGREHLALAREVEEEFHELGITEVGAFLKRPEFRKDRMVHEGPSFVPGRNYWQYRCLEIYSLEEQCTPSKVLADFIRSQVSKNSNLVLASTADIRSGRAKNKRVIADSASYLFSDKRFGLEPPPFV